LCALAAVAALVACAGCSRGGGAPTSITAVNATTSGDFRRPFDTVPSSDGSVFYFTGTTGDGQPAVFKVPAAGGAATAIAMGPPLTSPLGIAISSDDATLYVADPAAGLTGTVDDSDAPPPASRGVIFTLPTAGGTPAPLAGSSDTTPRGLDVVKQGSADAIYFSGVGSGGAPGLFQLAAAGGTPVAVASGDPFVDPSGVAVAKSGDIYVANSAAVEGSRASIIKIAGGVASEFVTGIAVGFPAGVALSSNEKTLLVSGHDLGTHGDVVLAIDLGSRAITPFDNGIAANSDAGGLHRARNGGVFSWADLTAGGTGQVYRVELK
jgi:sugar lactone lactonase YvrE